MTNLRKRNLMEMGGCFLMRCFEVAQTAGRRLSSSSNSNVVDSGDDSPTAVRPTKRQRLHTDALSPQQHEDGPIEKLQENTFILIDSTTSSPSNSSATGVADLTFSSTESSPTSSVASFVPSPTTTTNESPVLVLKGEVRSSSTPPFTTTATVLEDSQATRNNAQTNESPTFTQIKTSERPSTFTSTNPEAFSSNCSKSSDSTSRGPVTQSIATREPTRRRPRCVTVDVPNTGPVVVSNRYKFFKFHDNLRPPYYGTWSKRSDIVTGRRPFAKDTQFLDYDDDSDAEWQPEDTPKERVKQRVSAKTTIPSPFTNANPEAFSSSSSQSSDSTSRGPVTHSIAPREPTRRRPRCVTVDVPNTGPVVVSNRYKFFKFHDNLRPPYYGTWSKRSDIVTGRRPFAKDTQFLDYDDDSDAEWQPEDTPKERVKQRVSKKNTATCSAATTLRRTRRERKVDPAEFGRIFSTEWARLHAEGWTVVKAWDKVHNWFYIKPGTDRQNFVLGVNCFADREQLLDHVYALRGQGSVRDVVKKQIEAKKPSRPQTIKPSRQKITTAPEVEVKAPRNIDPDQYKWPVLWQRLRMQGWTTARSRDPLQDWYYLQPGVTRETMVVGKTAFLTTTDVIYYMQDLEGCPRNAKPLVKQTAKKSKPAGVTPHVSHKKKATEATVLIKTAPKPAQKEVPVEKEPEEEFDFPEHILTMEYTPPRSEAHSITPMRIYPIPAPLYTVKEFKRMWRASEEDFGCSTEEIEFGRLIRGANSKMNAQDSTAQKRAQYGRLLIDPVDFIFRDLLKLTKADCFIDIGHGIGNTVLQAAHTFGCVSRGIEVVDSRHLVALQFQKNLEGQRRLHLDRDFRHTPIGDIEFRRGRLEEAKQREWLTQHNNGGPVKILVNNFNGVFADRCAKSDQQYFLDDYVAGLFALTSPGSKMLTLHPLNMPMPQRMAKDTRRKHELSAMDNCSFYDVEQVVIGKAKDCVSWSMNGSCNHDIIGYLYTRLPQPSKDPVILCCNHRCEVAQSATPIPATKKVMIHGEECIVLKECKCNVSGKQLRQRR